MKIQHVALVCDACRHTWTGEIVIECSFELACASMKELAAKGCPACAKGRVCFDGRKPEFEANHASP